LIHRVAWIGTPTRFRAKIKFESQIESREEKRQKDRPRKNDPDDIERFPGRVFGIDEADDAEDKT